MTIRLTPLHKFIFTISVAAISIGILGWSFWKIMHKVDNLRFEIAQINSQIAALEEQRKNVLLFERLVEERPHDFERIAKFFVDQANPVVFIETLEELAKKTNNQIKLDVGSATVSEGELVFNLLIEGTKENVLKYLRLVELLPYKLRVDNFDFKSSGAQVQTSANASSLAELQVTLRVTTLLP